jgi:hypothetical protein
LLVLLNNANRILLVSKMRFYHITAKSHKNSGVILPNLRNFMVGLVEKSRQDLATVPNL